MCCGRKPDGAAAESSVKEWRRVLNHSERSSRLLPNRGSLGALRPTVCTHVACHWRNVCCCVCPHTNDGGQVLGSTGSRSGPGIVVRGDY